MRRGLLREEELLLRERSHRRPSFLRLGGPIALGCRVQRRMTLGHARVHRVLRTQSPESSSNGFSGVDATLTSGEKTTRCRREEPPPPPAPGGSSGRRPRGARRRNWSLETVATDSGARRGVVRARVEARVEGPDARITADELLETLEHRLIVREGARPNAREAFCRFVRIRALGFLRVAVGQAP